MMIQMEIFGQLEDQQVLNNAIADSKKIVVL